MPVREGGGGGRDFKCPGHHKHLSPYRLRFLQHLDTYNRPKSDSTNLFHYYVAGQC